MTQAELAHVSGVAQPNISAIENGRRTPSIDVLRRLLAGCGYTMIVHDGREVLVVPAAVEDAGTSTAEPPTVTPHSPMAERVRVLTAVLDASEAVVRART